MLEVKDISVRYPDGTKAVCDLSFTVGRSESVALIGANGAGKTSLLLSLVGVLDILNGGIFLDGALLNTETKADFRRKIGVVFQNPDDQLFRTSVRDDVAFGLRNFKVPKDDVEKKVEETLEKLGILRLSNRSPLRLSGGEKRIAAVATVLALDPSLLLLDEPSAFLDPRSRRVLIDILNSLSPAKLIATHDLKLAEETCSRGIVLKNGKLLADGSLKDLFRDVSLMREAGMEDALR